MPGGGTDGVYQVDSVIFEFPGDDGTVRLITLRIMAIYDNIFSFNEPLLCKGGLKALSIIIQGRMGDNLIFTDADHLCCHWEAKQQAQKRHKG
jgi:hypothetical protein